VFEESLDERGIHVMTQEEAFIQAIREAPEDDAPRLIFADWLEEHGQADRAEFIRLQCQLARMADKNPERSALTSRTDDLLRSHWDEWVGPFREIVGSRRDRYGESWMGEKYDPRTYPARFVRGFVPMLSLDAERFVDCASELNGLTPLRILNLWAAGRCARALANTAELKGLSMLAFPDYSDSPLRAADAAVLAASPYLYGLSMLHLGMNSLGDEGVEALVQAPWLVSVSWLDLTENGLSDRSTRFLADSPFLGNLRTLHLRRNALSLGGIRSLDNSANLRRLRRLEYDPPTDNGPSVGNDAP
jgi:uncharacterized protein (TIGR02996 family)